MAPESIDATLSPFETSEEFLRFQEELARTNKNVLDETMTAAEAYIAAQADRDAAMKQIRTVINYAIEHGNLSAQHQFYLTAID